MHISEQIKMLIDFEHCRTVIVLWVLTSTVINALHTLETPIREAFLKPRNFNPHPYEQDFHYQHKQQASINLNAIDIDYVDHSVYNIDLDNSLKARHPSNGIFSQAPHQFPPTLPPGQNLRNLPHPYATLKYKNEVNHEDNGIIDKFTDNNLLLRTPKKQYAFSYTVRDMHSGDDFSHTQQQKNGAVKGTYRVYMPDGRTQIVRYTADNDGYRAEVSYVIDKNAVKHQQRSEYKDYVAKTPKPHSYTNSYNSIYDGNFISSPIGPIPTATSSIFVTTASPPIDIRTDALTGHGYDTNRLSLEQRQSISAQPTYVVSEKSTRVSDTVRIVSNSESIDKNIADHTHHVFQATSPTSFSFL